MTPEDKCLLAIAGVQCCGSCGYSFTREDNPELEACGAPVDDEALAMDQGTNPIWAERKYGRTRVLTLLVTGEVPQTEESMDCERMPSDDGGRCALWKPRPWPVAPIPDI